MTVRKPVKAAQQRMEDLESLRLTLQAAIGSDSTSGGELAGLSRELRIVVREIDELRRMVPDEGSLNDELKKRRDRRVSPKGGSSAVGG